MTDFPIMLYKSPGVNVTRGGTFDYIAANDEDQLKALRDTGWRATVEDALAALHPVEDEPEDYDIEPTRAELEAAATELGLKFDGRTNDRKLKSRIEEAYAALGE